jgi:hypothetical protein
MIKHYNLTNPQTNKGLIHYVIMFTPLLLIINMGLGSQFNPVMIAGYPLNQVVNWLVILGVAIVVKNAYKFNMWPVFIIAGVIFSKLASVAMGKPPTVEMIYRIFVLILLMALGVIYVSRHLDLIYKQIMIISLLNVVLMILQVSNVGDWTGFLYTGSEEIVTYDIFFVPIDQYYASMFQTRPTGFLRASSVLSSVLLFAMALHFGREKNRIWWGTIIISAMIVLAGARINYLGYLLMGLLIIVKGNRVLRKHVAYSLLSMIIVMIGYSYFFPALFQNFWRLEVLTSSFYIRMNDIINTLGPENTIRMMLEEPLRYTPRLYTTEITSGYTILIQYSLYILALSFILIPYYITAFRKHIQTFPDLKWVTILCLLVFVVYPAAAPVFSEFRGQFYWVIGGFALSPIFIKSAQNNIRETEKAVH